MKKSTLTLISLIFALALIVGLASCDKGVEFNVNFIVDGAVYSTVGTSGEESIRMPEDPTKIGYTFGGWYWDDGKWERPFTANSLMNAPLSSDMSVYAKWNCVHVLSDWIIDKSATCTEEGARHKICTLCQEIAESEVLTALNHDIVNHSAKAPTCKEVGWDAYESCKREGCSYTTYSEKSALSHDIENHEAKAPTCTEIGWDAYESCKREDCSYTTYYEKEMLEHSYSDKYTYSATHHYYECECGAKKGEGEHVSSGSATNVSDEVCTVCGYVINPAVGISFKTLSVTGSNVYGKVSSDTESYSFINEVTAVGGAKYTVSTNITGTDTIPAKTIELITGDNTVYVTEYINDEPVAVYKVVIRRRPVYTVSFDAKGGSAVETVTVDEDTVLSAPKTTYIGYTFTGWDYDFESPIMNDTHITANWKANTNTAYKVEYYLENLDKTDYELTLTDELAGTTDTTATAVIKTFEHFTYNSAMGKVSGNINGEGNLVLKVYYTRNTYIVNTEVNNQNGGSVTAGGTYPYEIEINLLATIKPGYTFLGWFEGDTLVCPTAEFETVANKDVTYTAKWSANTNTAYKVEYYLENITKTDYDLKETDNLAGTTDVMATAVQKAFDHFTVNLSKSTVSGNIDGNGNLVLKVYYTRDTYAIKTAVNNSKGGTVTAGGTYPYETEINLLATTNPGYTFLGWFEGDALVCPTAEIETIANKNVTYTAKWSANTNTAYKVEYYLENITKTDYDLKETDNLAGTTDVMATAVQKAFDHFTVNLAKSTVSGNIDGNGNLVLKVYYTRNTYTVNTEVNNPKGGTVTAGGTYPYETELNLLATTNPGYTFLGWFEGDTLVCATPNFKSIYEKNAIYTAKWSANTNTAYKVEYYLENITKTDYDLKETDNLAGTTDVMATAAQKAFDHFTVNLSKSTVSGNIDGNGNLVLKVYYTRDTYAIKTAVNNSKGGTVTAGGTYPYETEINLLATTNPGYTFLGWFEGDTLVCATPNFKSIYEKNATYTAKWSANTNTAYKVEYYFEKLDGSYEIAKSETMNLSGTTDTTATAEIKTFNHFAFNSQKSTTSGNIDGSGNLVLKVYYTRNVYTASSNNSSAGSISGNGSYKYGSTVTAAVQKLGYDFIGWYSGETLISSDTSIVIDRNLTACFFVKPEMANFNFSSTATTCSISGIKDKTVTEIIVPDYVTSISSGAFSNCSGLKKLVIGNGVTSLPSGLLYGCSSLESITIPFVGGTKSASSASSSTLFGYIFGTSSYDGSVATKQYYSSGYTTTYYIPSSLKSVTVAGGDILYGAFYNCSNLTSVTIGNSVTSIGERAFYYCESLASVTIGNSVTSIGKSAFYDCSSLTSVTIGNSVTSIGEYAFYYCSSLTSVTIPNSVTSIGNYAFYYCSSLTSVTIGNGVKTIGDYAFYDCSSLTSVTIGNSVTSIGGSAFYKCYKLVEVINRSSLNIKAGSSDYGYIGSYAIDAHSGTSKIVNKDGFLFYTYNDINYLLGYAVRATDLILPDNYNGESYGIYKYAFYSCDSLTSVTIPDSVTSIGDYAFRDCSWLTSVTIPNSVTSIGERAFSGCYKLVEVINRSSLNIKAGSSDYGSIGYYAIEIHNGVSKIVNKDGFLFYTYNGINYLFGYVGSETDLILPDNYNGESYEIYKFAFFGCTSLTSVTIPDSVTSIGSYAFRDCSWLTSVTIPNSVTSIGDYAFYSCDSLTSVTIPDSVTSIGDYAFYSCDSLRSVTIGNSVKTIGKEAFRYCHKLTSVTIPNSVTTIGSYAFEGCSSLTIYCEAASKPSGWSSSWNSSGRPVVWGYKDET